MRQVLFLWIQGVCECFDSVDVAVLTCQDGSPAWHTNRVGDKAIAQQSPFLRQSINVWRLKSGRKSGTITSPSLRSMVVGHDEKDVGSLTG